MNPFERQDEVLELLYWFRGEKIGSEVTVADVERFISMGRDAISSTLRELADHGLVVSSGEEPAQYQLTAAGIREAQRRFSEEFAPYLGKESHLDCGEPDCDCNGRGEEACDSAVKP